MSDAPNIQQIREAEKAIAEITAKEAEMREAFMEDGLDKDEEKLLNAILAKIETLKAKVAKLRKDMERNKAKWEKQAKDFAAFKEKAGKMLDFDERLAEKAVRLEVDIEEAVVSERWADALMIFKTAEKEIVPNWTEYEKQFYASETYAPYLKDFCKRRDAALAHEGLTDALAQQVAALSSTEDDVDAAVKDRDFVQAKSLLEAATEALLKVEAALGTAPAANLSGEKWYRANQSKYPNSTKLGDLESAFQAKVTAFKTALEAAGVSVKIKSTLRDSKRAHIMHYAWKVGKKETKAADVPAIAGVDIDFNHGSDDLSVVKALEMVECFDIVHEPSKDSNHTRGTAIDWSLSWSGDLTIKNKAGEDVEITSSPRDGTNTDLHPVGESYGVHKLRDDPPHWSHDGK